MTEERANVDVDERPVEEAVEAVLDAEPSHDRAFVEDAMDDAALGGFVRRSAVEQSIPDVARAVSRAGNSQQLVAMDLGEAREAADPVADLDAVAARLDAFEADVAALSDRFEEMRDRLDAVNDWIDEEGKLYAAALGLTRLDVDAELLDREADDLQDDFEAFQSWLDDHDRRVADLRDDLDAVAERLTELDGLADALADETFDPDATDPAVAWCDASLRVRVAGLMIDDARAEAADLQTWADREGLDADLSAVADRIDALAAEREALLDRLGDLARPDWTERLGDRVDEFAADLADATPPIDWREVETTLAEYRPAEAAEGTPA